MLHEIKRVVGDEWGATLPVVLKLYSALVRPVLEYACTVWDCAEASVKNQLDSVQRAALLAATGAKHTTSSAALEVYCNVESLQLRREFLSASAFQRIRRLDDSHPVAQQYRKWREDGSPMSSSSLLPRAAALCSSFYRSSRCPQSPDSLVETIQFPIQSRQNRKVAKASISKASAKAEHLRLVESIATDADTLRVYTDGSAIPNPGRIGLGVSLVAPNLRRTISEPIGIGSNITAELCAIQTALGETLSLVGRYDKLYIFSDCEVAIDWAESKSEPSSNYQVVTEIRSLLKVLRRHMNVTISWVPGHVGVPGNEEANSAAQRGAEHVHLDEQCVSQPQVPYRVARAILKRGMRQLWQEQWIASSLFRVEHDHLSRIKLGVAKSLVFFSGNRAAQTALARLRFGHCGLASSSSRWSPLATRICECGCEEETVAHFLLRCPLYIQQRRSMLSSIRTFFPGEITEELLLGAGGIRLEEEDRAEISELVHQFVIDTKRVL